MGIWSGSGSAQTNQGGPVVLPGQYLVEIEAVKTVESWNKKDVFFVAELMIIESSNPERPVTSRMSWTFNMDNPNRTFCQAKAKDFMLKAADENEGVIIKHFIDKAQTEYAERITKGEMTREMVNEIGRKMGEAEIEKILEACTSAANPLKGQRLRLEAFIKPKKDGDPFTVCNWHAVPKTAPATAATGTPAPQPTAA